jgi:hypothetical protein
MTRTNIINNFIQKFEYKSYLEIGTQNPNCNFNQIEIKNKYSVEPFPPSGLNANDYSFVGTSDQYFDFISPDTKFDIVFIDGLHQYDQVLIDIE